MFLGGRHEGGYETAGHRRSSREDALLESCADVLGVSSHVFTPSAASSSSCPGCGQKLQAEGPGARRQRLARSPWTKYDGALWVDVST